MGEPILYILMRNDLPSMNAGKAMAQASHASNAFWHEYSQRKEVKAWAKSTKQGFGTVLVLSASYLGIIDAIGAARKAGLAASVVDDPSYPRRTTAELANLIPTDDDTAPRTTNLESNVATFYRCEMTCGYVFGTKEQTRDFLGSFPLHP
jgi:peptidyl-tRNA hydrolase